MNASFASLVLALKARKASLTDSLFGLLKALLDAGIKGFGWTPFAGVEAVEMGALKSPVQSFGGAAAAGDVCLTSAGWKLDLSAPLVTAGCSESSVDGRAAVDSGVF